jgi:hypothetical protein
MHNHGYNPAEMPPHEADYTQPLVEPEPARATRVVDLRPALGRAHPGETVWVCISVIKADKREAFLRHVREVKTPAVKAVRPEAHASVRLLEPSEASADGTWPFVWLMDPALPGEDYEMEPMYEAFYGSEKAKELLREWDDCHVGEQLFYAVTQTEW